MYVLSFLCNNDGMRRHVIVLNSRFSIQPLPRHYASFGSKKTQLLDIYFYYQNNSSKVICDASFKVLNSYHCIVSHPLRVYTQLYTYTCMSPRYFDNLHCRHIHESSYCTRPSLEEICIAVNNDYCIVIIFLVKKLIDLNSQPMERRTQKYRNEYVLISH